MANVSRTGDIILVEDESRKMRANIKVVDFDWAGDAGQIFYPLSRNPDIAGLWPGKPGGTINKDHDYKLVHSWWSNLISAWGDNKIVPYYGYGRNIDFLPVTVQLSPKFFDGTVW